MQEPLPEIPARDYYSIAFNLINGGNYAPGAITALYTIDDTLESIDFEGFRKVLDSCLPALKKLHSEPNPETDTIEEVCREFSKVNGIGDKAMNIVKVFTDRKMPEPEEVVKCPYCGR